MNLDAIQAINLIKQVNTKDIQDTNNKGLISTKEKVSSTNNPKGDNSSFKDILQVKKNDTNPLSDDTKNIANELEESLEDLSLEEVIDCLSRLVQMLIQEIPESSVEEVKGSLDINLDVNTVELDLNLNEEVTSIISDMLSSKSNEGLLSTNISSIDKDVLTLESIDSKEVKNIINNLLEVLKDDNIKSTLDETSLKSFDGLLKKIEGEVNKTELPVIKEAIKEVKNLLIDKKETSLEKFDIGTLKVNDIKTDSKEFNKNTSNNEESNSKDSSTSKNELKETVSKEEKVLKSILGEEETDKVNKFSLFTDRTLTTKVDPVQEAPVINKTTMVEDVIKSVKYMETNSLKELTVKINPKELGEIAIKLIQEDGVMKASIKANNKDTFSLLSQNINDIKRYLGEQNIKISEVNIGLYQDDTTFFKEGEFNSNFFNEERERNTNSNNNKGHSVLDDDSEQSVTLEDLSNISMLV